MSCVEYMPLVPYIFKYQSTFVGLCDQYHTHYLYFLGKFMVLILDSVGILTQESMLAIFFMVEPPEGLCQTNKIKSWYKL